MTRLSARILAPAVAAAAAALAIGAPLAAQSQQQPPPPGGFRLPEPSPSPTPRPAGPADERAGVVIPPRVVPTPRIAPVPVLTPEPIPAPGPQSQPGAASPRPSPTAAAPPPRPATVPGAAPEIAPSTAAAPIAAPTDAASPQILPETAPSLLPAPAAPAAVPAEALAPPLPAWWPWAAGGAGGAVLLGGAALLWRRSRSKVRRLSAPATGAAAPEAEAALPALPRLDFTLDITGATRSLMMFTLQYRLTIANRSDRAVNDLALGVELACARASASNGKGNAPSPGAAQALAAIARIGPHQARSVTGTVQLPLTAIQPLRQGAVPLFVPLVHVTVDGESARAFSRSFVIGPPSPHGAGRVHPIALDQPPGAILGLVAQGITLPEVSAAA